MEKKLFKWEEVISEFHKKINWRLKWTTKLILTEKSFHIQTKNYKWSIKRKNFMHYDINDESWWVLLLVRDSRYNVLPITITNPLSIIEVYNFLDKIKIKK